MILYILLWVVLYFLIGGICYLSVFKGMLERAIDANETNIESPKNALGLTVVAWPLCLFLSFGGFLSGVLSRKE